jgi:hydroxyacylglutathione hydrolase
MELDQFLDVRTDRYSYLLASTDRQAMVVDPRPDLVRYAAQLRERGLVLRYVVATTGDHASVGTARLFGANHGATVLAAPGPHCDLQEGHLRDGDTLQLGTLRVRVVARDGRAALVVHDAGDPTVPMAILGGTAFRQGVAVPAGGPSADHPLATLLGFPDWVPVYPGTNGIGAWPGGRRPSTTLGFERRFNPIWRHGKAS